MLACYEEILVSSSHQRLASPAVLLNIGDDDTDDQSTVQGEVPVS
jgi:hypothetical protein